MHFCELQHKSATKTAIAEDGSSTVNRTLFGLIVINSVSVLFIISRVSCQKGPTRHAYAWQIGPFWQDALDIW